MQIATTVSSRIIRQPRIRTLDALSGSRRLARFRRFIETTDWDRQYLCHRRIDRFCIGVLIAATLYFIPLLMPLARG